MKSKKQQLLELLQKGYHLSKLQILNNIGLFNSGARIEELRNKDGHHEIKTRMEVNKCTGDRFAIYYIET
jgi:hypothetical protein